MKSKTIYTQNFLGYALGVIAFSIIFISILFFWYVYNPKISIYPSSQEIQIIPDNKVSDSSGNDTNIYTITFWTRDKAADVLNYYHNTLPKDGWVLDWSSELKGRLIYYKDSPQGGKLGLTITAGQGERPNMIFCEIDMGEYGGISRVHLLDKR